MVLPKLAQIADYAVEAESRPISQYQGRPRLLALILSYVNRCQELEDAAWDVILRRMIDNAEDSQLDTIGKIVGQLRNGQDDATYRIYITARIRINRSQGHPDDVIDVLQLIDSAVFSYSEFYPCAAWIEYSEPPTASAAVLFDLARLAIASGVQLFLVAETQTDGFLFGDDTVGGQVDATHGLSNEAESTGGYLAGIW